MYERPKGRKTTYVGSVLLDSDDFSVDSVDGDVQVPVFVLDLGKLCNE